MHEYELEILLIEEYLKPLNYNYVSGYFIVPDGETPECIVYSEVLLRKIFLKALIRINPIFPNKYIKKIKAIIKFELTDY